LWDALTVETMFIDNSDFERRMERIMERFDSPEKPYERKKTPPIDGERLFNNQDICSIFASGHCSVTARWDVCRFCG
jgi:hypothetical protein